MGGAEPPAGAVASCTHGTHTCAHAAGYSRVKLATHRESGQQYAVKIIPLPKRERWVVWSRGNAGDRDRPQQLSDCVPVLLLVAEEVQSIDALWQYASQWATLPPCCFVLCAAGQSVNKYLSNRGAIMKVGADHPIAV